MRKIFAFSALFIISLSMPANAAECLSLLESQICVGETHDSVLTKLPNPYATGQTVNTGTYGPQVDRSYEYHGQKFTLRFERTSADGPIRLTRITEQ